MDNGRSNETCHELFAFGSHQCVSGADGWNFANRSPNHAGTCNNSRRATPATGGSALNPSNISSECSTLCCKDPSKVATVNPARGSLRDEQNVYYFPADDDKGSSACEISNNGKILRCRGTVNISSLPILCNDPAPESGGGSINSGPIDDLDYPDQTITIPVGISLEIACDTSTEYGWDSEVVQVNANGGDPKPVEKFFCTMGSKYKPST